MLSDYGIDLTNLAEKGELDPLIMSDGDINRVMQILCKRRKNSPCLLGRPGIRVASVVEGLAKRIANGSTPMIFQGKKVIKLKKGNLLARCESTSTHKFGERLVALIDELEKDDGTFILFVDDLDLLLRLGGIVHQCIGAITRDEYKKHIESNSILRDDFHPVDLPEHSMEEMMKILKVLIVKYEAHHNVKYMDEALTAAAHLSSLHTGNEFLIDKAIDMIDEAGARVSLEIIGASPAEGVVTKHHIEQLIPSVSTCISPVPRESQNKSKRLLEMEEALRRHVVGQEEAVESISRALLRAQVGVRDTSRPVASFFFTGPTGVGKTELANAVAIEFFGPINSMKRLDMSEYKERHSVARLFGAPPGYRSCLEGGQLTNAVLENPQTVLLLDEIEKAHQDVYDIFLQILENGRLTDGRGIAVDFTNTIIIFTSNIGYKLFNTTNNGGSCGLDYHQLKRMVMEELKKVFRPELLNRLDDVLVFRRLTQDDMAKISEMMLNKVSQRAEALKLTLTIGDSVKNKLIEEGYDPAFGARPLRRCITRVVEDALAQWIADGDVRKGDSVLMDIGTHDDVIKYVIPAPRRDTNTQGDITFGNNAEKLNKSKQSKGGAKAKKTNAGAKVGGNSKKRKAKEPAEPKEEPVKKIKQMVSKKVDVRGLAAAAGAKENARASLHKDVALRSISNTSSSLNVAKASKQLSLLLLPSQKSCTK